MAKMTPTDIAQQYSSMGDSVNLINKGKPLGMPDEDMIAANVAINA